ncbi:MAG: hypothetical protein CSA45_02835 [Gammaproteobacteria bacterium]|nr:MAG: hypothetical protein CSA45_02835 [Gammaproteobacteria bacterium]
MKKIIKYFLLILLALSIVLLSVGYYFLNTTAGLDRVIDLANRYSGYDVHAEKVSGKLLAKTELQHVTVKGKLLDFSSERVVVDWNPSDLFKLLFNVQTVEIHNSVLTLSPNAEKIKEESPPIGLSDLDLPIELNVKSLLIDGLTLQNPVTKKTDFVIDRLHLGVDYIGQLAKINLLSFQGQGIDLDLTGQVETRGKYPLNFDIETIYKVNPYDQQALTVKAGGALKEQVTVQLVGDGLANFALDGVVKDAFEAAQFNGKLSLYGLNSQSPQLADTRAKAELTLSGNYQQSLQSTLVGTIDYDSPQTDKLRVQLQGQLADKKLIIPNLTVDLLTAGQQLFGTGQYSLKDNAVDVDLHSDELSWPQSEKSPAVVVRRLMLSVDGHVDDYKLSVDTNMQTEAAGDVPVTLSANGSLAALDNIDAVATVNGKPISVKGNLGWQPQIDYTLQLRADGIEPIRSFPGVKKLLLDVVGDADSYRAKGGLDIYADTIPSTQLSVNIDGSPTKLNKADIVAHTLGGKAEIHAQGNLSPLDLTAGIATQDIRPQQFYTDISGNINSQISLTAKQQADNLVAVAVIEQLAGDLQKKPLSGTGKVSYDQIANQLNINQLRINVAGNRIDANGILALDGQGGHSDLTADIDAKSLRQLLPDLSGSLQANIVAKGSLNKPQVTADIQAKQLAFQTQKVGNLLAKADINPAADKLLLTVKANHVVVGGNDIHQATVDVNGKISSHRLNIDAKLPKQSLALSGNGGLNLDKLLWSGKLTKLDISDDAIGRWRLSQTAGLTLSAEDVGVKSLCLKQQSASLCADGRLVKDNGQFDVVVKQLATKPFAKLIPEAVGVDTVINGKAKISFANGKPSIDGKFSTRGGRLKIAAGRGSLVSKIKRFETDITLRDNRLVGRIDGDLQHLGRIQIEGGLPDIGQSDIRAKIKLANDSLAFLPRLVPQLSNVSGKLAGNMQLSGDPSKRLNIAGKVALLDANFNVPEYGSQIRHMNLDVFALNGSRLGFKGGADGGRGRISITGDLNPATRKGNISIKGNNFQAANSRLLKMTISPDLKILFAEQIKVRGTLNIPKALVVPTSSGSKITASEDVILPNSKGKKKRPPSSPVDAEITVKLGDDVRVASADIETRLTGGLNIVAKPGQEPKANGTISIQTGELRIYGQKLNIERGHIVFSNGPIADPSLDVRASRKIEGEDVVVGANVLGSVSRPEVSLFSVPGMSDSSILSYLLFGRAPDSQSFGATALLQTGGLIGANTMARDIRSSTGLDVLNFSLTGLEAGKNLTKKAYVGIRSNFFESLNEFLLKYKISGRTHVDATISSTGEVSTDVIKEIETD